MEACFGVLCRGSKKNELAAELSFWYGFDVGALPRKRQLGLWANLPRVQAQDSVHKGLYEASDYRGVYDLYMAAYGNEQLATAARTVALKVHMQQRMAMVKE